MIKFYTVISKDIFNWCTYQFIVFHISAFYNKVEDVGTLGLSTYSTLTYACRVRTNTVKISLGEEIKEFL